MKINEILIEKRDTHCSDKCCGSNVKAEDCKCPPTCKHCNCNAVSETATAGGSSAGGVASTGNGFLNGGPGTLTRAGTVPKKKKTNKKKR